MRIKLTDLTIQNLKFQLPQQTYWDVHTPAFGVRVGLKTKTFIVMQGKSRKRFTIGRYPALKLADARKRAATILTNSETPSATSVAEVLSHYLGSLDVRPRTESEYRRLLHSHMLSRIENRTISSITARDILAITDPLLPTPTECRHAHVAMQTFFNWCVPRYIAVSPLTGLKSPTKPNTRVRTLSQPELAAIWAATALPVPYHQVVRLCILTAQRRGEIAQIQPSWIDGVTLTIPAHVAKNGRQHSIPLSPTALALAKIAPFQIHNWSRYKTRLDALSGVTDWVLHDIRRTAASIMAAPPISAPPHLIERILNHVTGSNTALGHVYQRYEYAEEIKDVFARYDDHLAKIVTCST